MSTKRLLSDALKDVRNLSTGQMLPELEELSFPEAITLAIANHKRNTGTLVIEELDAHHPRVPVAFKNLCISSCSRILKQCIQTCRRSWPKSSFTS